MDRFRKQGVRTVFIAGVKTQRCVFDSIRELYAKAGVHVVALEDCIATDQEEIHRAFMGEIKAFNPPVLTSQTLIDKWDKFS